MNAGLVCDSNFLFCIDFVKSSHSLERLNVSHNMLTEFSGDILSNNKRLIALDVSHNQITTFKLNEASRRFALFIYLYIFRRQLHNAIRYSRRCTFVFTDKLTAVSLRIFLCRF